MNRNRIAAASISGLLLMLCSCADIRHSVRSIGTAPPAPELQKHGTVTQLLVDGKPFLVLGGELHNSSSSSPDYMKPIWPKLAKMNLNTVLSAVSWEQIEPREGQFDFTSVDAMLREARRNNLRLVLLWFGSWKNGTSRYEADWVKSDLTRFPRVLNHDGKSLEILSTFNDATCQADGTAYAALMKHLKDVDSHERTVIMMQMQNEVGILGDTRDHSAAANDAFAKPVPSDLLDYLQKNKDTLLPELRSVWDAAGNKTSGTWEEVFGKSNRTDEIFMAWNYARYINRVNEAGKAQYALPTFVNAWIVQPEDKAPGDYPSGGPQAQNHDLYRAGAPSIDILAPDIYLPNFPAIVSLYGRSGNPMFVPESRGGAGGVANAYFAIGQFGSIGYSPFGIDGTEDADGPLSHGYATLAQLAPAILENQGKGTIAGVWLNRQNPVQAVQLGNYVLTVQLRRNRRAPDQLPESGYAMLINVGADEYLCSGSDVEITFAPNTPGDPIVGLLKVEEGAYHNGEWIAGRRLNGDEVQLRYDLSAAAAENQAGTGLRFGAGNPGIQKATLYRYR